MAAHLCGSFNWKFYLCLHKHKRQKTWLEWPGLVPNSPFTI